jgi:hypothetical protein
MRILAMIRGRTGAPARTHRRAWKRGMSTTSLTLETAAVMGWFVFMIRGEKLVGDATSARRSVENTTQQSARVSGNNYCQGGTQGSTSGAFSASPQAGVDQIGVPDIGEVISLVEMLGFGPQATFANFTNQFKQTTVTAQVDNVKAAALIGGNSMSFKATSQAACREKALDTPGTSITTYRTSVYLTNILGWSL